MCLLAYKFHFNCFQDTRFRLENLRSNMIHFEGQSIGNFEPKIVLKVFLNFYMR